jgi:hypothetical protein
MKIHRHESNHQSRSYYNNNSINISDVPAFDLLDDELDIFKGLKDKKYDKGLNYIAQVYVY